MLRRLVLLLFACIAALGSPPPANCDASLRHAPHYLARRGLDGPAPHIVSANLAYRGGHDGTGIQATPRVYLVFYGRQWGRAHTSNGDLVFTNDPAGLAPRLQQFLRGLFGTEHWSTSTTQYCDHVATGRVQCRTAGRHVTHASTTPLAGVWHDTTYNVPSGPTSRSFRAAAVRAAKHFGNTTAAANISTQYIVVTPAGIVPPGFGTQFCAYHDWYATSVGDVAYVALPYIADAGIGCGANLVHAGRAGALDGVTIVAGHEYAEALTDPFPPFGWTDADGEENADKCAWIASGPGAAADVALPTGTFPVQSLWSNNANGGRGACVVYYASSSTQH